MAVDGARATADPEHSPDRQDALRAWVGARVADPAVRLEPIPPDAGRRQYFRARSSGRRYLACLSPPTPAERDELDRFLRVRELLHRIGVRVPAIVALDPDRVFVLQTDLGPHRLSDLPSLGPGLAPWRGVRSVLRSLAGAAAAAEVLPDADEDYLYGELAAVRDRREPGRDPSRPDAEFDAALRWLCRRLDEQPKALGHMDFHGRNIIVDDDLNVGVVDFQDARRAPAGLDLATVVFDQNLRRTAAEADRLIEDALDLQPARSRSEARTNVHLAGLYWCARIVGVCSRLGRVRHPRYLDEVDRALHHLRTIARRSLPPETAPILDRLLVRAEARP